ncbi:membrane protein [Arthrobacter sp. SPG23]|nr:membrane protein [Arthrobacter sp. SPG23]
MKIALRVLTALALFIDAGVHIHLAPGYQGASPAGIGQGNLFLIESAAAILAGLYVLVRGSRASYALALVVALSAFAAVVLYRYVDVPAFGPFPAMYDPVWFFEKSLSAVAEGAGALLAAVGLVRVATGGPAGAPRRSSRRRTT